MDTTNSIVILKASETLENFGFLLQDFELDVVEAWKVYNQEGFGEWADPGSFMQYHIYGPIGFHIWILRHYCKYTNHTSYWVDFNENPAKSETYEEPEAIRVIEEYIDGFLKNFRKL